VSRVARDRNGHAGYDGFREFHKDEVHFFLSWFPRLILFGREQLPVMRQSRGRPFFLESLNPKYNKICTPANRWYFIQTKTLALEGWGLNIGFRPSMVVQINQDAHHATYLCPLLGSLDGGAFEKAIKG
jgi:hypothetical protein